MFGELDITVILFLIALGLFAAFIDSVVGGGGLIMLPGLLFLGVPPTTALATNKFAGSVGSFTSTVMFYRSGKINLKEVGKWFPLTFFGSILGAYIVTLIDPNFLKPIMLILLAAVLIFTVMKKDWGNNNTAKALSAGKFALFLGIIFLIGFYDGFLGPGTGSFLIFAFLLIGYDFVKAAGSAKLLNFGSNIGALLLFLFLGHVNFFYGIILAVAQIIGSIIGSRFAIRKGTGYIRALFIMVTLVLLLKNTYDYFS